MKTTLFTSLALSSILGFTTLTTKAQTSMVDQSNIPSNTASTISPGQTFGQSFTAGVTSTLTGVAIGLNTGAPITSCIVKVFAGSGYAGTLLAIKNFTTTGAGLNSVYLNTGVPIVSGNVYTFQFSSFGAPIPVNYHSGNPYPGGSYFNNGTLIPSADAIFKSYVKFVGTPGQFNSATYNITSLDETMNYWLVPGSANYRVKVTGVTTPSFTAVNTRNNNWNTVFKMNYISGLAYGETYNIQLSYYKNGVWSAYGVSSTVNTPAITPTTQLTNCSLSYTVASTKTKFTWVKVVGATNYKVEIVDPASTFSVTSIRNNNLNTFALNYVAGTLPFVQYDVTVIAYVGGVWGTSGFPCHVTAMSTNFVEDENSNESTYRLGNTSENLNKTDFLAELFPNPSNGNFNLNLSEDASVLITNMLGDVIANQNVNSGVTTLNIENQPKGIYFATITTANSKKTLKIVKQ